MPSISTIAQIKKNLKANPVYNHNAEILPKLWLTDWLLFVLQQPNSFLFSHPDYQLSDAEYQQYQAGIQKMQAGTPLPYLLGYQEFWSLKFLLNEYTLIPRPDSEILVEQVLAWIQRANFQQRLSRQLCYQQEHQKKNSLSKSKYSSVITLHQYKLLDLGTGTGCLAISLAHELHKMMPNSWQITAVDFCPHALKIAKKNATLNQVSNIEFMQSNWFKSIAKASQESDKFNIIISNPPYIDKADSHLTALAAEPTTALVADKQGLADIESIIQQAPDYLQQGGLLAVEHGFRQGRAVRALLQTQGWQQVHTVKDYGANERITMAQWQEL